MRASRERRTSSAGASEFWTSAVQCVTVSVLCYCNSLRGDFVHDDTFAIVGNPDAWPGSPLARLFGNDFWGKPLTDSRSHKSYRPLCVLTFRLNACISGVEPLGFHVLNVLLHTVATLLFLCTCRVAVFTRKHPARLAALLFASHPVHCEAVAGIVGRADVLACVLYLLTFLTYVKSLAAYSADSVCLQTVRPGLLVTSLALGTCAMFAKETGVTVLGVCVGYDIIMSWNERPCPAGGLWRVIRLKRAFLQRVGAVTVVVVALLCFRIAVMGGTLPVFTEQDNPASFSPHRLTRFLSYSNAAARHAWLLLCPSTLCYDWQADSIPRLSSFWDIRCAAPLALFTTFTLMIRRALCHPQADERQTLAMGLLFLTIPFLPASNLFFPVGFVLAERVLYMPSMGACVLVSHGLDRLGAAGPRRPVLHSLAGPALVILYASKTIRQNEVWHSRETLFRSGVQTLPHNAKAHYNYANWLKDVGRLAEAAQHYQETLRLAPNHSSALNNLGTLTNNSVRAEQFFWKALSVMPNHSRAMFNLGSLYKVQGRLMEAEHWFRQAIATSPLFPDPHSSLAAVLTEQGRPSGAEEAYREALKALPGNANIHNNYAVFLATQGDRLRAERHYRQAMFLQPSHAVAMSNLGRLYRTTGHSGEAEKWFRRSLSVKYNTDTLELLGALYYHTGRLRAARDTYQQAVQMAPENARKRLALAQVLSRQGDTKEAGQQVAHAITLDPNCLECFHLQASLAIQAGHFKQALISVQEALGHAPTDKRLHAELLFSQGNCQRELHQFPQAFKSYQQAVELYPGLPSAWINMGAILHLQGDYSGAHHHYQQAIRLDPQSPLLQDNIAKLSRAMQGNTGQR
uniref:protein O-mannosyl-transferase TMTC1 n=1 Tax=Myxine glutinosa TaxID=7769 RepID=UPI00358F7ACC